MVWGAPVPHHGLPPPRLLEPPPVSRPVRAGGGTTGETAAARSSGENGETLHRAGPPSGGRLWWFGNASRFPRFFLCNCESRSYWWLSVIDGVRCCCKMVKLTPAPRYRVTPALLQELQSFQWIPNIIRPNSLLWWNSEIDPSDSSPTKWHRVGQSGDCRQIVERSRWGCKTCQVVSKSGTRCPRWHRWWHQVYSPPATTLHDIPLNYVNVIAASAKRNLDAPKFMQNMESLITGKALNVYSSYHESKQSQENTNILDLIVTCVIWRQAY